MVDEVQIENRDPQEIHNRSYTVKAPFTREARAYEVGEAIALDDATAQDLIEQGLLVNPEGDQQPEDQVAPASEPVEEAPPAESEPASTSLSTGAEEPAAAEETPPKGKKGSRSTDKG
jgi:hypothetical protein